MKKIATLLAIAFFATCGSAFATDLSSGSASAAGAQISGTHGSSSSTIGSLSTNVKIVVQFSPSTFAAITKHYNGVKTYGTSSGDTKLFFKDGTAGSDVNTSDCGASDSTNFDSGWTSL
jgi:hypothetical protein